MIDRLAKFADKYVPPFIGFIFLIPILFVWWAVYGIGYALISISVPFAYNDKALLWWTAHVSLSDTDRWLAKSKLEDA